MVHIIIQYLSVYGYVYVHTGMFTGPALVEPPRRSLMPSGGMGPRVASCDAWVYI